MAEKIIPGIANCAVDTLLKNDLKGPRDCPYCDASGVKVVKTETGMMVTTDLVLEDLKLVRHCWIFLYLLSEKKIVWRKYEIPQNENPAGGGERLT